MLALVWLITANLIAMLPSQDHHWRAAALLMGVGFPLLIWIACTQSLVIAAAFLTGAASILRWPLYFLWRWISRTKFS